MVGGATELHRGDEVVSAGALLSVCALISAGRNNFLQVRIGTDSKQILVWWMSRYCPPDSAKYGSVSTGPCSRVAGVQASSQPVSLILCSSQSPCVPSPCSVCPRTSPCHPSFTSFSLNVCNSTGPIHGCAAL